MKLLATELPEAFLNKEAAGAAQVLAWVGGSCPHPSSLQLTTRVCFLHGFVCVDLINVCVAPFASLEDLHK